MYPPAFLGFFPFHHFIEFCSGFCLSILKQVRVEIRCRFVLRVP